MFLEVNFYCKYSYVYPCIKEFYIFLIFNYVIVLYKTSLIYGCLFFNNFINTVQHNKNGAL